MSTSCSKYQDEKKLVAELIFKVLSGEYCVREALEKFPCKMEDNSLQCAWHALIHFEADEDFRKNDAEYAEEQNKYLESIASMLETGESLPENIIQEYNKYYDKVIKSGTKTFVDKVKSVFRFIV